MTDFIVMRHGEAHAPGVDPERGLTEDGREDASRTAGRIAADGVRIERIVHSGKKRAAMTAEILAGRIGMEGKTEVLAGLHPNDAVDAVAAEMDRSAMNLAVVGHLPSVGRLIARLLGREEGPIIRTAEAIHLRRTGGVWEAVRFYSA